MLGKQGTQIASVEVIKIYALGLKHLAKIHQQLEFVICDIGLQQHTDPKPTCGTA